MYAGDQSIEIATLPAVIQQAYGIAADQKDLLRKLDEEAPIIAEEEDELAEQTLYEGLQASYETDSDEDDDVIDPLAEEGDLKDEIE